MDPLLEIALRAALAGGEAVMRVYADPFEVIQKDDKTPVTEADLASERAIVAILTAGVPGYPDRLRGDRAGGGVLVAGCRASGASIRSTGPRSSSPATASSRC